MVIDLRADVHSEQIHLDKNDGSLYGVSEGMRVSLQPLCSHLNAVEAGRGDTDGSPGPMVASELRFDPQYAEIYWTKRVPYAERAASFRANIEIPEGETWPTARHRSVFWTVPAQRSI